MSIRTASLNGGDEKHIKICFYQVTISLQITRTFLNSRMILSNGRVRNYIHTHRNLPPLHARNRDIEPRLLKLEIGCSKLLQPGKTHLVIE